eukprot:6167123-Alexandrium_andersonii.AAC.1
MRGHIVARDGAGGSPVGREMNTGCSTVEHWCVVEMFLGQAGCGTMGVGGDDRVSYYGRRINGAFA